MPYVILLPLFSFCFLLFVFLYRTVVFSEFSKCFFQQKRSLSPLQPGVAPPVLLTAVCCLVPSQSVSADSTEEFLLLPYVYYSVQLQDSSLKSD